jgi:hypothetical protein
MGSGSPVEGDRRDTAAAPPAHVARNVVEVDQRAPVAVPRRVEARGPLSLDDDPELVATGAHVAVLGTRIDEQLGEGAALDQLQADDPPLLVREVRDRLVDRMRDVAAVLRGEQFVVDHLERHPLAAVAIAAGVVGEAAARDRVQQPDQRARAGVHARECDCRVGEHLLRQLRLE